MSRTSATYWPNLRQISCRPNDACSNPSPASEMATQQAAIYLVVHSFTAIGHDAQQTERLCQILGRLSFSSSGRSCRSTTQFHRQSLGEGEINTICQGCYNQTTVETHVLVTVSEFAGALPNQQLVEVLLPIEAKLTFPFELATVQNTAHIAEV